MGQIINGREIATNIKEEIKSYVDKRTKEGKDIPQRNALCRRCSRKGCFK